MRLLKNRLGALTLGAVIAVAASAQTQALTWLGYGLESNGTAANGGNDKEPNVEALLALLGMPEDITLLGKSDDSSNPSGFTPALNTLHGSSTGTINYGGSANVKYITIKVGNAGPSGNRNNTYHLYLYDGPGTYNLLTDPFPVDFVAQGNTVSHISVWTAPRTPPPPPPVPDGGATAALLGLGMLGLVAARKASK